LNRNVEWLNSRIFDLLFRNGERGDIKIIVHVDDSEWQIKRR